MDSDPKPVALSAAHPETMDFLSKEWCNFAVQALQPPDVHDRSIVLLDNSIKKFESGIDTVPFMKMDDDSDFNSSMPPWKSDDLKSWLWMQQAMHPELNYNSCFRKKWFQWKSVSFRVNSIKKWLKEMKQKKKEQGRLQKAQVHAAISIAGLAAALAAVAAENTKKRDGSNTAAKDAAVASAAALIAAQCAQVAEAMGAKRDEISSVIGSAMNDTSASDILTLSAAAKTSLKGAATLKARTECKMSRLNGNAPILPIEDNEFIPLEFENNKSLLAKGTQLGVESPDGKYRFRSVKIALNTEGKVVLKLRKLNLMKSKKECIVLDLHAELYKEAESKNREDTCYLIVLRTNIGSIKIDMEDDYQLYNIWASTISHLLIISSSISAKYQLQFPRI